MDVADSPDILGGALVAMEARWVHLYLGLKEATSVEAMNGHVPLGCCVMRLNRSL